MVHWSKFDDVYFVEGSLPGAELRGEISEELNGVFSQSQLKSLDDVKRAMLATVQRSHGNAVLNFKYGQRSSFWKSLWGMDNVHWFATGTVAVINPDDLPKRG